MAYALQAWRGAFWAFWAFTFISWILALIGLASLQAQCYGMSGMDIVNRGVGLDRPACNSMFGKHWWFIAFTFITLVGLAVVAAMSKLRSVGMAFLAWLAVLAVYWINASDSFLGLTDTNLFDLGRERLMAAASIMLAIGTLVLAFILGCRPSRGDSAGPLKY